MHHLKLLLLLISVLSGHILFAQVTDTYLLPSEIGPCFRWRENACRLAGAGQNNRIEAVKALIPKVCSIPETLNYGAAIF